MQKQISSTQNPAIRKIVQLQEKSRTRKKEGLFIIEGIREIKLAFKGSYQLVEIFYCPEIISSEKVAGIASFPEEIPLIEINAAVYEKIAVRESTEGVIAVAKTKKIELEQLHLKSEKPLILVAEAPEKPGNIGALLRTADAAGLDAVLIANPKTDLYNPNIIRSSVGCIFTNKIATGSTKEIISFLKEHNIAIFGAALQASVPYSSLDFNGSCAIVVGTESSGLSDEWLNNATQNIVIPMQGEIDSMNVSVAAGILIFEAKRQRNELLNLHH